MGFSLKNTVQPELKLNNISTHDETNLFLFNLSIHIFIPEPHKH